MDTKCEDRILKEMQMSFKRTEERKAILQSAPAMESAWQPVQHRPKLIPDKPTENERKIIKQNNLKQQSPSGSQNNATQSLKSPVKLTNIKQELPDNSFELSSNNLEAGVAKNSPNKQRKPKQALKVSPKEPKKEIVNITNIHQEITTDKSTKFAKRKSNLSTVNGIDKRIKLEPQDGDNKAAHFQALANGLPSGKSSPTKATNYSSKTKKSELKSADKKVIPKVETTKKDTRKPKQKSSVKEKNKENSKGISGTNSDTYLVAGFDDFPKTSEYSFDAESLQNDEDYSESTGSENAWEQESAGTENSLYSESSDSEYSLDSDENFFRKPEVYKCKNNKNSSPVFEYKEDQEEERPWLMDWPQVEAEIKEILVFDKIVPEPEHKSQEDSMENAEVEDEDEQMEVESDIEEQLLPGSDDSFDMPTDVAQPSQFPAELSIFENSLKTNNVLAVLKEDVELYGTVVVTLLCGRITINGFKARPNEPLTIYSPKGVNWVAISPMCNKKPPKGAINWHELSESFSRAQLDNIMENYDSRRDAIVLLQRNSGAQNLLNTFAKHMAENIFPLVNATNRPHYASEYVLNCLVQSADLQRTLQVPRVWTKLALQSNSRLIVAGGKGVGKSTLVRYLLNRHLERFQRLLFIDLDIGQPELFLPQTVSCSVIDKPLLGPGFFLNRQPDQAYVVGHVNVVMCAEQYGRAVRQLLANCRANESYAQMPWLVNTMGYNKGFGLELMALLVDCVQPTDLVQIASSRAINNFDAPLDWRTLAKVQPIIYTAEEFKTSGDLSKYTLHQLQSALPQLERRERGWQMSAKDVRYANLLSRLSATLRGNAKHLTDCPPLQVALGALQIVHLTAEDYTREELIAGMEANLVYLCKRASGEQPVECLGMGVVRAIDHEAQKLYLLPAMPLTRLSNVNSLVLGGDMCLPQGFFKDQGAGVANNVPFVFIIDDTKSSKSIQQIYFRAPGFLGQPAHKNA